MVLKFGEFLLFLGVLFFGFQVVFSQVIVEEINYQVKENTEPSYEKCVQVAFRDGDKPIEVYQNDTSPLFVELNFIFPNIGDFDTSEIVIEVKPPLCIRRNETKSEECRGKLHVDYLIKITEDATPCILTREVILLSVNECERPCSIFHDSWCSECDLDTTHCVDDGLSGYQCKCKDGFVKIEGNDVACKFYDPCDDIQCDIHADCIRIGTNKAECKCREGFFGDGFHCEDVDECATGKDDCNKDTTYCVNTIGSYLCCCKEGFSGENTADSIKKCLRGKEPCKKTESRLIIHSHEIYLKQYKSTVNEVIKEAQVDYLCDALNIHYPNLFGDSRNVITRNGTFSILFECRNENLSDTITVYVEPTDSCTVKEYAPPCEILVSQCKDSCCQPLDGWVRDPLNCTLVKDGVAPLFEGLHETYHIPGSCSVCGDRLKESASLSDIEDVILSNVEAKDYVFDSSRVAICDSEEDCHKYYDLMKVPVIKRPGTPCINGVCKPINVTSRILVTMDVNNASLVNVKVRDFEGNTNTKQVTIIYDHKNIDEEIDEIKAQLETLFISSTISYFDLLTFFIAVTSLIMVTPYFFQTQGAWIVLWLRLHGWYNFVVIMGYCLLAFLLVVSFQLLLASRKIE